MTQLVTKSLAAQMQELLRQRIVWGDIQPGGRIDLDALAAEFDISVSPVRDAVRLLERDGLVVIRPRKGVYAAPVDPKAFRDVFDVRIALECLAVAGAVDRIPEPALVELEATYAAAAAALARTGDEEAALGPSDSAIHDLIVQHCDNGVVRELVGSLRDRIAWVRRLAADRAHRYRQSFAEHRALLAALRGRDHAAAAARLREHLTRARDHTLAALATSNGLAAGDEA